MNLILLFPEDYIEPGRVVLSGRRHQHMLSVHRAQPGDLLQVGDLNGKLGHATVIALSATSVELQVHCPVAPPQPVPITLVLALPRPKVLKRTLQSITTLGIKKIILINAWRVEKSYWGSPALQPAAIHEQLLLGLEQARDTVLPEVLLRPRFKPFVEDELAPLIRSQRALVAHPEAQTPCPRQLGGPIILVVGPEGGFIPYEVDMLSAVGCQAIEIGPRILRVETAVTRLVSLLV